MTPQKHTMEGEPTMKTFLLPESGSFYKANLHCHTTLSDGRKTPEEIKELYRSHGYSVVAFTDHNILIAHPELADEHFLPLNGFEAELNESKDCGMQARKTCHLCFVSLDPDNPNRKEPHSHEHWI